MKHDGLRLPSRLPPVRAGLQPWTPQTYANEGAKLRRRPWRKRFTEEDLAYVNAQLSDEAMRGFERVTSLSRANDTYGKRRVPMSQLLAKRWDRREVGG